MRRFVHAFTQGGFAGADTPAPIEAVALRFFGLVWLALVIAGTFGRSPHPAFHGRGAWILALLVALIAAAMFALPWRRDVTTRARIAALVAVTAASAGLVIAQPSGVWVSGPLYVAIVAGVFLERREAVALLGFSLCVLSTIVLIQGRPSAVLTVVTQAVPWYAVMRLLRAFRENRDELEESRAAEARAAAAAERGRLSREMHDVLAHSLSALALQLETTRLLARSRGVDEDVAVAIDRAHHLAASGLDEARRAIATQRGDELPGPERIGALADAFAEQSGLPVELETRGEPRELAPEARLAIYRTAQEALTNVRRHATAERVEVTLDYLRDSTVLVVEDHSVDDAPQPVGVGAVSGDGYGLTGMRERAELLGGELRAEPTGNGFRVELRLPR